MGLPTNRVLYHYAPVPAICLRQVEIRPGADRQLYGGTGGALLGLSVTLPAPLPTKPI